MRRGELCGSSVFCHCLIVIPHSFDASDREDGALRLCHFLGVLFIQYNLNGSNTDGSFILDDSNSFFSPYKILPIAQENKYLMIYSYLIIKLYVVCTH